MTESALSKKLAMHWSKSGMMLFRNQVGTYQLRDGRWLSSGLCIGSSDLIGWTPVIVTQEMVGKPLAVFTAVEVKKPGRDTTAPARRERQAKFLMKVRDAGGLAVLARDVVIEIQAELKALLER